MLQEDEDNQTPLSAAFQEEPSQSSEFKVKHKFTLGDTSTPTYCVRFDYNDKYIAASCGDGSIRIFNVFTQKQSYVLNTDMVNKMPTTTLRWRPLTAPGVTKNVLIATNAEGSLLHFHTTSGKLLHRIYDEANQLLTADYKPDGMEFLTGGEDGKVRVYDEQTRQLKTTLAGGGSGEPGHSNRVFCAKFV
jgi:WD40 repeat protein